MWGRGDIRFFDRISYVYDIFMPSPDVDRIHSAFGDSDLPKTEVVIDLAGGTGRVGRSLRGVRSVVIDVSRGMLVKAKRHNLDLIHGDASNLPLFSGTVDAVVCVDAFHHLPNGEGASEEVRRVLRSGGVFVIVDFDPTTIRGRFISFFEKVIGMNSEFYTPNEVALVLEKAGFETRIRETGFEYVVVGKKGGSDKEPS